MFVEYLHTVWNKHADTQPPKHTPPYFKPSGVSRITSDGSVPSFQTNTPSLPQQSLCLSLRLSPLVPVCLSVVSSAAREPPSPLLNRWGEWYSLEIRIRLHATLQQQRRTSITGFYLHPSSSYLDMENVSLPFSST